HHVFAVTFPPGENPRIIPPVIVNKLSEIGPAVVPGKNLDGSSAKFSGRVTAIAINPNNTNLIYLGTNGGVWASADGGSTWTHTDNELTSGFRVSAITVDEHA